MSASSINARSSAMAPPANNNTLKRKTLAERAGETSRPVLAPPSSRPVNPHIRTTSITGASRETSFSTSVSSSRPSSTTSTRNASNSSYASSLGQGSRPPSAQAYRPQSAMSYSRIQKPMSSLHRPTTSLENHEEEPATVKKRKGMTPFSLVPQEFPQTLHAPKVRKRCDLQADYTAAGIRRPFNALSIREASLRRQISLSTAFSSLNLNNDSHTLLHKEVVEQSRSKSPTRPAPKAEVECPQTPSHIPKLVPLTVIPSIVSSPNKSAKKTPKAPPQFLNKDSNTHVAWDTDSRLEEVENMCSQFKEKWDGATTESKSLKEMMTVYKIRSVS